MINVFPILFLVLCCLGAKIAPREEYRDALSLTQTKHLRGCAAIAIVFHHISQEQFEMGMMGIFSIVGAIVCSLFFFWAGYGLMLSAQKKENYFFNFIRKRIGSILSVYFFVFCIYSLVYSILGILQGRLQVFYRGTLVVDNSWYVVTLIILYIGYYVIYKSKTWNLRIKNWLMITWLAIYIILFRDVLHWGLWWVNSCFPFVMGICFAQNKNRIDAIICKRYSTAMTVTLLFFGCVFVVAKTKLAGNQTYLKVIADQISCCAFCFMIYLINTKFTIGNKLTGFLGKISLELYLMHGLFINCLIKQAKMTGSIAVSLVLGLSVISAYGLHLIFQWLRNTDSVKQYFPWR